MVGAVYLARWPVQVACFALAAKRLRAGRRHAAFRWCLAGAAAVVLPYLVVLMSQSWPGPLKVALVGAVLGVAFVVALRRQRAAHTAQRAYASAEQRVGSTQCGEE